MNKTVLLFVTLFSFISSTAQYSKEWKEPSKESQAYSQQREQITEPPYGLDKVEALINVIKEDEEGNHVMDKKTYQSLTLRQKFTYHMLHAESYSQNCDGYPTLQDEHKKIFGHLPELFGEEEWSERQLKFFTGNKDSVIKLMKLCIEKDKRIGLNFKHAIVEMNAKEMIPFLVKIYDMERKDHDILTVLLLLMKNNEYEPFLASSSNKKLYGDDSRYYEAYLVLNKANQDLIIKRATDYHNGISK